VFGLFLCAKEFPSEPPPWWIISLQVIKQFHVGVELRSNRFGLYVAVGILQQLK
jgi:hypothetical protein